jgi:hypothetical protein
MERQQPTVFLVLILSVAATLAADLEAVAGAPVALDPRLSIPACPDDHAIAWRADGRALIARCQATGWRIVVPVAAPAASVRRGDRVRLESGGAGFLVRADAIVEQVRADGQLTVRTMGSARRVPARLLADGRIVASR